MGICNINLDSNMNLTICKRMRTAARKFLHQGRQPSSDEYLWFESNKYAHTILLQYSTLHHLWVVKCLGAQAHNGLITKFHSVASLKETTHE